MLQQILVGIAVVAAALFAAWRLPGTATRLRYARWLQGIGSERNWLHRLGDRLYARQLRAIQAGGCAACSARDVHAPRPSARRR